MSQENGHSQGFGIAGNDAIRLDLRSQPITNNLLFLLQNPNDRQHYLRRKLRVSPGLARGPNGEALPNLSVAMYDVDYGNPVPHCDVEIAAEAFCYAEAKLKESADPEIQRMHGAVGIAMYEGRDSLPLEAIIYLVGVKYYAEKVSAKMYEKSSNFSPRQ
jgi:hypothetical protein